MKRFHNDVFCFDLDKNGGHRLMQETLQTLGLAGYEIVGVVQGDMHSRTVNVFVQLELPTDDKEADEAA